MKEKIIKTDVLIIGGGLAGCMASIRAKEEGAAEVIVAEKGHIERSGNAGAGIDHIWHYNPEFHGTRWPIEDLIRNHTRLADEFINQEICYVIAKESYERILDLEKFGIKIRDDKGQFRIVPQFHSTPSSLHFEGRDIKVALGREVLRRGIQILNRVMITRLLASNGMIVGATGINGRNGEFITFHAKAIVLTTGSATRLFKNKTGYFFNTWLAPHDTGDGHAMAFKAGAELTGMEFTDVILGPKNLQRAGLGSYYPAGRLFNALGEKLPAWKSLEGRSAIYQMYLDQLLRGKGPIYMDCTRGKEDEIKYIESMLPHEGGCTVLFEQFCEKGLNLRRDKIEHELYEPSIYGSGVIIDKDCRTSLKGLFAAGDVIGQMPWGCAPGALVMGWKAGAQAAKFSKDYPEEKIDERQLMEEKAFLFSLLNKKDGIKWQELQLALQNIMTDYAEGVKTEASLKVGLTKLEELKNEGIPLLVARNSHELIRSLEVINLVLLGEMVIRADVERKESRCGPYHLRADYPETDDVNWFKWLILKQERGEIKFSTEPVNHIY